MTIGGGASLVLDDVTYAYEGATMRFALSAEAGEWLALIGPSGAGKSTLLDLVAGFVRPQTGRILIAETDVTDQAPGERPVSLVFQENNLFPHLTALQNVCLGLSSRRRPGADIVAAAQRSLSSVGLAALSARRPAEMSGGERQRVALARAFVRRRPVLLLDEPFAALGPALRQEMLALLADLRRTAFRPTILMVTHHPDDAVGFADRIAFLDAGTIAAVGCTETLLRPGTDPRIDAYLGTRPPSRT